MPTEKDGLLPITVVEVSDMSHAPNPGNAAKYYFDLSTGTDWATGDFYTWNGTSYALYAGPHPIKPGH